MKRHIQLSALLASALLLAMSNASGQEKIPAGVAAEVVALRATVETLRSEVVLLRKAVVRLELERHRDKIQRMKGQIETLRAEHARLMEFDRARQQDLQEVEELLLRGEVPAEQRLDVESARSELAVTRGREIAEQSDAVRVREGELVRQLETEEQAAKRLEEALKLTKGKAE